MGPERSGHITNNFERYHLKGSDIDHRLWGVRDVRGEGGIEDAVTFLLTWVGGPGTSRFGLGH